MRLHPASGRGAVGGRVVEGHDLVVAARLGEGGQDPGVEDRTARPRRAVRLRLEGVHPAAQPRRHQRDHLGQRLDRRLLDPAHAVPPAVGPQADGDRDGLLVLEEQRRQVRPGPQLVAAGDPADRVDVVPEVAEPVDVAAQRPGAHLEPLGQLAPGPEPVGLQEGQQPQHPRTRAHVSTLILIAVR